MRSLLIDTNILMLLLVGRWDRDRIQSFRRTSDFSTSDYDLLDATLGSYPNVVTTGPVLTEVSNVLGNEFHTQIAETVVTLCEPFEERSRSKSEIFGDAVFARLGFADVSILLAADEWTTVLTDDVHLYLVALDRGLDAINFRHLRGE